MPPIHTAISGVKLVIMGSNFKEANIYIIAKKISMLRIPPTACTLKCRIIEYQSARPISMW